MLDQVVTSTTRASDRFEARDDWRMVALLPETDEAGASAAMHRLQAAFTEALGPALTVRLIYGLTAPAPAGTLGVAFHQAGQLLVATRRLDSIDRPGVRTGSSAPVAAGERLVGRDAVLGGLATELSPSSSQEGSREAGARLDTLRALLDSGYIDEAEYQTRRTAILDRL